MKGKHQQSAHDLAQLAARLAASLDVEEVTSFQLETGLQSGITRVTLRLTNGDSKVYVVEEEKEEPGRFAPSLPF